MVNLLDRFSKYPEFQKRDGVELTGQQLAEELAAELAVKVENVLSGDLNLDVDKTYLVRPWLNQSIENVKIATPEDPNNGQLLTPSGRFTTHSS